MQMLRSATFLPTQPASSRTKTGSFQKAESGSPLPSLDSATLSQMGAVMAEAVAAAEESPLEGAKSLSGMFKLYQKDGQVWMALKPEQLNKPFFFSRNVSRGIGERWLNGAQMGDSFLAEFRKVEDRVQLVALHTENFAEPNSPQSRFVEDAFSDSLLSSAPVVPGKEGSDEIVVSAQELIFGQLSDYQARINQTYESSFALDVENTHFTQLDNHKEQTSFGVQAHYQAAPGSNGPSVTPLPNSVLTEFRYNFLELPEDPMQPRLADERVGHFITTRKDYTDDEGDGLVRMVNRWRLEKKDPGAELSEPVEPITYWIGNEVPKEYRRAVREGILEWNKAFEAIGFKDAIEVRQQRSDSKFDPMDARHASVRWYTASDVGAAVGPSQVDPRTGEILDADIRMADVFGRSAKRFLKENPPQEEGHAHHHDHSHGCDYQTHAASQYEFASQLLEARGDEQAADELAQAYVKDVIMHEVGHTLGLRHNFKASTVFTPEQLQDPEFTKENGVSSSVMDYNPFNLAGPGETQGEYVMSSLGAYDYLAVQYAYQPLEEGQEAETLNQVARRTTTEPMLTFETDEAADGMDPEISRFDLGSDPLAFAQKEITLAHELWERAQGMDLPEDTSYFELTKAFSSGLGKIRGALRLSNRYVGGVTLRRDRAGTENPIYEPIAADKQRAAVELITTTMFSPKSFQFKPEFVARLGRDRFRDQWGADLNVDVGQMVLGAQSSALRGLFDDTIAQRITSNPEKLPADADVYRLSELYDTVQSAIWTELSQDQEISQGRRDLQREYLSVVGEKLAPESSSPGEAKSLLRFLTGRLKKQIDASLHQEMSLEKRAHLEDSSLKLEQILNPKA